MRIGPFEIAARRIRRKAFGESGRWYNIFSGGQYDPGWFQKHKWVEGDSEFRHYAAYSCETLISGDIGKLRFMLTRAIGDGLTEEIEHPDYSPVLKRPNPYQNHIQFKEWWISSKLMRGNAYALKQRDRNGVVKALYLLNPLRTMPMVAPDGTVFYSIGQDYLSLIGGAIVVPQSEIIHDRMNCLFHPLVGTSPIFACGVACEEGLRIIEDARRFFGNSANPGGLLTSPGKISEALAERMQKKWQEEWSGDNIGKVAVLGEGLAFTPTRMTSVDAQLVDQLRMTGEIVCSTFHVPAYKVGVGPAPLNNNVEALDQQYYSQCLQTLIENMEACLSEGLGLDEEIGGEQLDVELDLSGLLRMDAKTQMETLSLGVEKTILTPNDARNRMNYPPKAGGDALYKQQQNFSLEALAKRDALPNPFVIDRPTANPTPSLTGPAATSDPEMASKKRFMALVRAFDEANLDA